MKALDGLVVIVLVSWRETYDDWRSDWQYMFLYRQDVKPHPQLFLVIRVIYKHAVFYVFYG